MIKEKKQAISKTELAIQKLGIDVQNLTKDMNAATNMVAHLEKEHEWIHEDKEWVLWMSWLSCSSLNSFAREFGKKGGQFDFGANNMPELKARVEELSTKNKGMKKSINPKVLAMIDKYVTRTFLTGL